MMDNYKNKAIENIKAAEILGVMK